MPSFSVNLRRRRDGTSGKCKVMGSQDAFLSRINKTFYYGKLPVTERFSLPVTELATELFSEVKNGHSLDRLHLEEAAAMSRNACVSPCSLVLALLYLERLKTCNPEYLHRVASSELFLVSLMVASKFLHDDGEEDEVFNQEWAASADIDVKDLNRSEKDFLNAMEWEVFVSEQAFWNRLSALEQDVALREGLRRGWFTYSDMDRLLNCVALCAMTRGLIKVWSVCLTSYTAGVLTMIGSAMIASQLPCGSLSSGLCTPVTPATIPTLDVLPEPPSLHTRPADSTDILTTGLILASLGTNESTTSSTRIEGLGTPWSEPLCTWVADNLRVWQFGLLPEKLDLHTISRQTSSDRLKDTGLLDLLVGYGTVLDDGVNGSGLDSNTARSSHKWSSVVPNWLDLTVLERFTQTHFVPLKVTAY